MDVKSVFKVIFLTITLMCVGTFVVEFYNASVNSALLRQKMDAAAESSLNYFTQESFRKEGDYSTVNLPAFSPADDPFVTYVSGDFYEHADRPEVQAAEMFNWFPQGSETAIAANGGGGDASNAVELWKVAMLTATPGNNEYIHSVFEGGQQLGFTICCKRLPTLEEPHNPPYNRYLPGLEKTIASSGFKPGNYMGVICRYTEAANELRRWNALNKDYSYVTGYINQHSVDTSSGNDQYVQTQLERRVLYEMGAINAYTQIQSAVNGAYSPANVGFPMFSWQVNRMFKWHLCSALAGVGVSQNAATGPNYTTPAIMRDDSNAWCMKWNGFNVYASEAQITQMNYYCYNLYNDADAAEFREKAGLQSADLDDLRTFQVDGYNKDNYGGKLAFPNTVVDEDGNAMCFVTIVEIEYTVPVAYEGLTPFREVINWLRSDDRAGYEGFKNNNVAPTASGTPDFVLVTNPGMTGTANDDAMMVNSALQFVVMP